MAKLKLTEKQALFIQLVKEVWEARNDGTHGFFSYRDFYIAIEPYADDDNDYLSVIVCEKLDFLNYAHGQYYNYADLNSDAIYDDGYLLSFFKQLVKKDNWHYGYY